MTPLLFTLYLLKRKNLLKKLELNQFLLFVLLNLLLTNGKYKRHQKREMSSYCPSQRQLLNFISLKFMRVRHSVS